MTERVGIYSGSFDPVHNGHVAFCLEAMKTCELNRVLLLPEKQPRRKPNATPIEHRVAMLRLAAQAWPQLEILCLQSDYFTIEKTLPEIYAYTQDADLTMLFGSDVVAHMASWPGIDSLVEKASLAIGLRKGDSQTNIRQVVQSIETQTSMAIRAEYITTPNAHAASSHLRLRAPRLCEDNDINPAVAAYIIEHRLYAQEI